MARPNFGIFGALMALGGFLAVRYVQHKRAAQLPVARELSRWEGEGGAVVASQDNAVAQSASPPDAQGSNGSAHQNGNGRAWPFPRS